MSEATLRLISGPAEDEETVTVQEMRAAMSQLDEALSRISDLATQLKARGYDNDWFDSLAEMYEGDDFNSAWGYWIRSLDDSDESAADRLIADTDTEDDDDADDE